MTFKLEFDSPKEEFGTLVFERKVVKLRRFVFIISLLLPSKKKIALYFDKLDLNSFVPDKKIVKCLQSIFAISILSLLENGNDLNSVNPRLLYMLYY